MAFPTTGVLDTFDRANADPIDGNWTTPLYDGESGLKIVSNAIQADSNASRASYWSTITGADCEAFLTLTQQGDAASPVATNSVFARIDPSAAPSFNGYRVAVLAGSPATIRIRRVDAGSSTTLGAEISATFTDGDKIGIECVGTSISAYQFTGGSWSLLGSRTDGTYTAAGFIGIELYGGGNVPGTAIANDFGGGTVSVAGPTATVAWIRA